jgi:hypothetical protein
MFLPESAKDCLASFFILDFARTCGDDPGMVMILILISTTTILTTSIPRYQVHIIPGIYIYIYIYWYTRIPGTYQVYQVYQYIYTTLEYSLLDSHIFPKGHYSYEYRYDVGS